MIKEMIIGYIVLLSLLVWRALAVYRGAPGGRNPNSPNIILTYLLPLMVCLLVGFGLAIPFLYGYPSGIGYPIWIRRAYVLVSHAAYAAAVATVIYFAMSSRDRGRPSQIQWSLGAMFVVLTLTLGTNILGAVFNQSFTGTHFLGAPSDITRVVLFWACAACFLITVVRTFGYRSASEGWAYWGEPLFIVLGLGARVVTAVVPGMAMDALAWL